MGLASCPRAAAAVLALFHHQPLQPVLLSLSPLNCVMPPVTTSSTQLPVSGGIGLNWVLSSASRRCRRNFLAGGQSLRWCSLNLHWYRDGSRP